MREKCKRFISVFPVCINEEKENKKRRLSSLGAVGLPDDCVSIIGPDQITSILHRQAVWFVGTIVPCPHCPRHRASSCINHQIAIVLQGEIRRLSSGTLSRRPDGRVSDVGITVCYIDAELVVPHASRIELRGRIDELIVLKAEGTCTDTNHRCWS